MSGTGTAMGAGAGTAARRVVWCAALAALLARFPSMLWPLRPDEAGFLLVARRLEPTADSLYGHYWVDRPPPLIWLVRATDAIGGPYAHRLLAALGCAALVLAVAASARELASRAGVDDPAAADRVAAWTAVGTAAVVANAWVDASSAKGELFGIPLVAAACWLSLRAVRRRSALDAFLAGLLGATAMGFKQNIVGGLVFGAVLLVGSLLTARLSRGDALRCGLAATAGAAVPVAVVVGWALATGVRLRVLWYAVVSFRADASGIISAQASHGPDSRILVLALVFVGTGMAVVSVWFAVRLRDLLRLDPVVTVAVATMLVVDLTGVVLSGSYWLPYLHLLVPGAALALALLVTLDAPRWRARPARTTRVIAGLLVVASAVSLVVWTARWGLGRVPVEARTGEAIAAQAAPGDDVMVYGGRADIQWASGLGSPYPYLWSLPMRTLDPGLVDLGEVLTGPEQPTWFVEATYVDTWSDLGVMPIEQSLISAYEFVQTACDRYRIYHVNTVRPIRLDVDCTSPYRTIWGD